MPRELVHSQALITIQIQRGEQCLRELLAVEAVVSIAVELPGVESVEEPGEVPIGVDTGLQEDLLLLLCLLYTSDAADE